MRGKGDLADGFEHGFEALERIDLSKVSSFSDLVDRMSRTALAGRATGEAAEIMTAMFGDPDCLVVGTFSGPMTIAKQDLVIADLIAHGCLDIVISTGAIICHGLVQELGRAHFKYDTEWSDAALFDAGYNRVYDTIELEQGLDDAERLVSGMLQEWDVAQPVTSFEFCRRLGEELVKRGTERGILQDAYRKGVPVFIPAFTDSELGLDVGIHNHRFGAEHCLKVDALADLEDYTLRLCEAKHLGILTIGGGVPRNWAQQVGPYMDAMQRRGVGEATEPVKFSYGVRICPEPVHWGGLSGCTYSEGVSWGKFAARAEGGRFAEVLCDATAVLPLLVLAVFERMHLR